MEGFAESCAQPYAYSEHLQLLASGEQSNSKGAAGESDDCCQDLLRGYPVPEDQVRYGYREVAVGAEKDSRHRKVDHGLRLNVQDVHPDLGQSRQEKDPEVLRVYSERSPVHHQEHCGYRYEAYGGSDGVDLYRIHPGVGKGPGADPDESPNGCACNYSCR